MQPVKHALACIGIALCLRMEAQKNIVILGSSTAAGASASTFDSSWVGRLQGYFRRNLQTGDPDTTIIDLAVYGFKTYDVMPDGYVPPAGRPAPDTAHNVSKALRYKPDLIIISLPNNDVGTFDYAGTNPPYTINETLNNFIQLYQYISARGVSCFITAPQPRNDLSDLQRLHLHQLRDSILQRFQANAVNFWDDLVADTANHLRTDLAHAGYADSLYHLNNKGHLLLFKRMATAPLFTNNNVVINTNTAPPKNILVQAENYTSMSGVGTESTTDAGGGQDVDYIDPNDWMDYNVNAPYTGQYTLKVRVASAADKGSLQVRNGAGSTLAGISVPNTGGWQNWQTVSTIITLPKGQQTLRFISTSAQWNDWNINWWELDSLSAGTDTAATTPAAQTAVAPSSQHIEAENYSNMSGVATESTTDTGGGFDVAYIDPNDWMDYAVNVPAAGTYTVRFRVATPAQSGQLQLRTAAGTVLTTVSVPNTGGWQSWQTVSATVSLSAGQQTLRIVCTSPQWNGWNINWWELSGPGTTGQSSRQSLAALQPQLYENREPLGLYPNPIVDQVQLTINNALAGAAKVQVATLNGAIVKEYTIEKPQGASQTQLSLASLPKGQYLLIVQMKGWKESVKFMKAE